MVGTVIFKNFETGSYREMKITGFDGKTYTDIGKGEYFSCTVNLDERSIVFDRKSSEDITFHSMDEIFLVAQKAKRYLYRNIYATVVEFCLNMDECTLRTASFKCGVYEPPDVKSLFNNSAYYMLIGEFRDKSPLWLSAFCDGVNFAFHRLFGTSERFLFFSSAGIYINLAVFPKGILSGRVTGKSRIRYICSKRDSSREFNVVNTGPASVYEFPGGTPSDKFIHSICSYRCTMSNLFLKLISKQNSIVEKLGIMFDCTHISEAVRLTDDIYPHLLEVSHKFFEYGYLEAKSHSTSLTIGDVLLMASLSGNRENLALKAKATSVNFSFLAKLPCPPYFDGDGTAIWE